VFNLFWRPYVPGFRLSPHDDVPGFNIDQNGLPWRANTWRDGLDSMVQRYPEAALTETLHDIGFGPTQHETLAQSAAPIGLAAFRPRKQDEVFGFNVNPWEEVPGLNPNEDESQHQETNWSVETLPVPSEVEYPVQPGPSQFPEWVYKLATMLPPLSAAFDPSMEWHAAIGSLPTMPLAKAPNVQESASSNVPLQPAIQDIHARGAITQTTNPPPTGEAMSSVWPRALSGDGPYAENVQLGDPWSAEIARQSVGIHSIAAASPVAGSEFVVENAGTAGEQQAQQRVPVQQYQQRRPIALSGAALDSVRPSENGNMGMGRPVGAPEPKFSPITEVYRPPKAEESSDNGRLIRAPQALAQIQEGQTPAQLDLSSLDAGGLPTGAIISSDGTTKAVLPKNANFLLVGDGDVPGDLPPYERHERGVRASIATHIARGFELVTDRPRAVDVPGFPTPRYYDYIIRDPVTGQNYGVEVKTTLYDTIRLDPAQVMKDAVVVAQGAKVRLVDVHLNGVSYVAYCFGCETLDFRSAVLQRILLNAGVRMRRSALPGETRP
jgi:hypothetical protein